MKMISLQMIRDNDPCTSGWKKVKTANSYRDMDELFPLSDILESNDVPDTIWALRCVEGGKFIAQLFALECAKSVMHLAKDERVVNLVELTEKYLNGKATIEELEKAIYEVDAIYDTRYAAYAARYAADYAADAAAYAVDDVDAVDYATNAANAIDAVCYVKDMTKVLKQLLDGDNLCTPS